MDFCQILLIANVHLLQLHVHFYSLYREDCVCDTKSPYCFNNIFAFSEIYGTYILLKHIHLIITNSFPFFIYIIGQKQRIMVEMALRTAHVQ